MTDVDMISFTYKNSAPEIIDRYSTGKTSPLPDN